ncbi:hypothetical protein [Cupriavidus basilensis]|uniref:hypothetical protein n=1 Tax=Cupriavidus basilensis TaxID=68895 RepID=UPI0020A6D618|nr:hypothetical protein [Cupriavidus basilensis]MCP3024073.1 hypothetical protein [Cupriavidus basilensis]
MDAVDYASQREDARQKWMPQVLKTIVEEAPRNATAQSFLAHMKARAEPHIAAEDAEPTPAASVSDTADAAESINKRRTDK